MAKVRARPDRSRRGRRGYHHGDLKAALVNVTVQLLRTRGPGELSLREIARRAGVSHAAPYAHFEDLSDLLVSVALEGFERLRARLAEAAAREQILVVNRLEEMCIEYVRFAVTSPEYFRVMFGASVARDHPRLAAAIGGLEALVTGVIREVQSEGALVEGDPAVISRAAWAMVHGLASLAAERRIGVRDDDELVALVREATNRLYFGLAPPQLIAAYREIGPAMYERYDEMREGG